MSRAPRRAHHVCALLCSLLCCSAVAATAAGAATAPDPRAAGAWHLADDRAMGLQTAWDRTTGSDTIVAVLDTGADLRHPDLAPNLWRNPGEIARNGVDDDRNGWVDDVHGVDVVDDDGNPQDDNGHGTHVAGIIGARGDNGVGLAGVAWRTRLMVVKVLDARASGDSVEVAVGLRYAVSQGARVVNLSLAGATRSKALESAIDEAAAAGVLVVVAAGNAGQDLGTRPVYPAALPQGNVLAVAATTPSGNLFTGSSFGSPVDLGAPGEAIESTALGGGYELRSGTSMAAPMVAGAAVLLADAGAGPGYKPLVDALTAGARRTGLPVAAGGLDVAGALREIIPPASGPRGAASPVRADRAIPRARSRAARAKAARRRAARAKARARARVGNRTNRGRAIVANR